ncbi:hypothetical protein F5Y10DRAFT_264947 [Nemania abortiva]|nr:hypothetical protein F5Y10DRAFT_264947 [Nemania abortiva]
MAYFHAWSKHWSASSQITHRLQPTFLAAVMGASAIDADVLSMAVSIAKWFRGALGRNPENFLKLQETMDPGDGDVEKGERDARKAAVAEVEQPSKKGLQDFIHPQWVHELEIPNHFNKQDLCDDPAGRPVF